MEHFCYSPSMNKTKRFVAFLQGMLWGLLLALPVPAALLLLSIFMPTPIAFVLALLLAVSLSLLIGWRTFRPQIQKIN